jgi:hypothetical protein
MPATDTQQTAVCLGITILEVGVGGLIIRRRWEILFVQGISSVLRTNGMRRCLGARLSGEIRNTSS